jgi:hypothetical protein
MSAHLTCQYLWQISGNAPGYAPGSTDTHRINVASGGGGGIYDAGTAGEVTLSAVNILGTNLTTASPLARSLPAPANPRQNQPARTMRAGRWPVTGLPGPAGRTEAGHEPAHRQRPRRPSSSSPSRRARPRRSTSDSPRNSAPGRGRPRNASTAFRTAHRCRAAARRRSSLSARRHPGGQPVTVISGDG